MKPPHASDPEMDPNRMELQTLAGVLGYSPMIFTNTRFRLRQPNPPWKICSRVPISSRPSVTHNTTSRPMIWRFMRASALS